MYQPLGPSSARKHRAILDAAEALFLRDGYLGSSMDEVADRAGVSKQTVYTHFGSKELLFVALVTSMTLTAGDELATTDVLPETEGEIAAFLRSHAIGELQVVMTPRLLRLRRLVIGEVARFPELAEALFENGPQRSIRSLTVVIEELSHRGLLHAPDAAVAATTFNWLIMASPLNDAMLRGDRAIPSAAALEAHAAEATRVFLAAYAGTARDVDRR